MPAVIIDMSDDFRIWDNPEAVILESTRRTIVPLGADPSRTRDRRHEIGVVPTAKRRALTNRELLASGGVYTGQDLIWLLPQQVMTQGLTPKPADVVIDGQGNRWTVLEVFWGKWKQTWRLTTRDLVLAHALRDKITIERATRVYDAAGVPAKLFPPDGGKVLYANLPARVQLQNESIVEERGIRGTQYNFTVVVDRELDLDVAEDRIVLEDDRILDITGYRNAHLITELPVVEAAWKP